MLLLFFLSVWTWGGAQGLGRTGCSGNGRRGKRFPSRAPSCTAWRHQRLVWLRKHGFKRQMPWGCSSTFRMLSWFDIILLFFCRRLRRLSWRPRRGVIMHYLSPSELYQSVPTICPSVHLAIHPSSAHLPVHLPIYSSSIGGNMIRYQIKIPLLIFFPPTPTLISLSPPKKQLLLRVRKTLSENFLLCPRISSLLYGFLPLPLLSPVLHSLWVIRLLFGCVPNVEA